MNNKMCNDGKILSFMDFLDLDEEVIDLKAKSLMKKDKISNTQLRNLIYLFQYKHLINVREDCECDNDEEYDFLFKLNLIVKKDNLEEICTIINLVLTLNPDSIVSKSEHLLQQILSDIYLPPLKIEEGDGDIEKIQTTMICLKMCGSILNALKKIGAKLSLPFLGCPLEHIICSGDKELQVYFLQYSVPIFFEVINGFNILDRIWIFLKQLNDSSIALKVICCLSNYYLPIIEKPGNTFLESAIIEDQAFWDFILNGLLCKDQCLSLRKQSIYLAKRAIDYAFIYKKNIKIESKTTFIWSCKGKNIFKKLWDNYFILIDSLEEKQNNIVLPSLKLFESIKDIGHCWVTAAFNIGLKHDNSQVRLKCLQSRLHYKISNELEAISILDVINDLTLIESININHHIQNLNRALSDVETLVYILQGTALVKWSPVPLFFLTSRLAGLEILIKESDQKIIVDILNKILKIPCNNIIIRRAIHINISHFIAKCLKTMPWREYIGVYPLLEIENPNIMNPFVNFVENDVIVPEDEIRQLLDILASSYVNIQFALIYFRHRNDTEFLNIVGNMIDKIQNVSSRQYSNKLDCLSDAIFVAHMYKFQKEVTLVKINSFTALKAITQYVVSLLSSDEVLLDIDKFNLLLDGFGYLINHVNIGDYRETFINIYKSANLLLKDSKTDLQRKLFALCTINVLFKSSMHDHWAEEVLHTETFAIMIQNLTIAECNKEYGGRSRNAFYEKLCEVVYILSENGNIKDMINFIDVVLECGGYGCLKWILKITNKKISQILDEDTKFNLEQFLIRIWREIEELKSNNQYSTCIEQFVILLTQDALLKRSTYNELVLLYFSKILDYASIKFSPLYFLVKHLSLINVSSYKHMVIFLSEILLYANIPNKEQRITDKIEVKILEQPTCYGIDYESVQFNAHIKYLAVSMLSQIRDTELLNTLMSSVKRKIDELLKNKLRYHENSYLERSIEACLQSLLIIVLKSREVDICGTAIWCMEFLGRMPHQPYVKICLEWYISLYFYLEKYVIDEKMLHQLKSRNVPLLSQFRILYWIVISKIKTATCSHSEFDFVMELLTSHSMGATYSVRIYAQYISTGILNANTNDTHTRRYTFIRKVMQNCLSEATKLKEKSFMTLLDDYFIHGFGIIRDLSFSGIYYTLPLSTRAPTINRSDHNIFTKYFLDNVAKDINESLSVDLKDEFLDTFEQGFIVPIKWNDDVLLSAINDDDDDEESQTIQKKYVPWKTMSNIDVYNTEERTKSDLILVASLIDKLPNLGGMARTGEVFGVNTYVVDSFRHLQSKGFQDLSVSAERWVNVEEVRPGEHLKEYLMLKKTEGYTIVAAEQTSTSVKLQDYKFPKKTLLILGHEKEGISCDLLPFMDHCVEIPQQGVIRSLNVHVTAAIFVWEYTRQHML